MAERRLTGKKVALFDLDGVVFDTEPQYTKFWGGQCRLYFPDEEHLEQRIKGQTLNQIFASLFSSIPSEHHIITERLNCYEKSMDFNYVSGVVPFVKRLNELGFKTAVVTSSNNAKMEKVYEAHPSFKSMFHRIFTSEDFKESKPSPACYLTAVEYFGAQLGSCIGFEDSPNGLMSLCNAGIDAVALSTSLPSERLKCFTDLVINDFNEISVECDNTIKIDV